MELRLVQYYALNVRRIFALPASPEANCHQLWHESVPRLSLESANILYAMLALTATHLIHDEPDDEALVQARNLYVVLSLREQAAAVNSLCLENTDSVALSASMININAFVMLRERSLSPYSPAVSWLETSRNAGNVLWQAANLQGTNAFTDSVTQVIKGPSADIHLHMHEMPPIDSDFRKACDHVSTSWGEEGLGVYRQTLGHIAAPVSYTHLTLPTKRIV